MCEKKEIYLLPYAHLDTQWRWEYPTTIRKYIPNTMKKNFSLLKRFPGYVFNFTGMIRYAMMKEYYPDEYEVLKDYVELGRWHPVGTCMDETDAIVPAMESMIRNILYGRMGSVREFGRSSCDYLLPDCFGFPGNMPTVLAHMGIQGFSTQKLTWQSAAGIPFQLGLWIGPDGSKLPAAVNPGAYTSRLHLPVRLSPGALKRLREQGEKTGVWKSFQYYGTGDMGGAPSAGSVWRAVKSVGRKRGIAVRQGPPDRFYSDLTQDERDRLDSYEGDLLLTRHSAGTLTSAAIMKRWNRKNEQLAFAAEAAAASAQIFAGVSYPHKKIQSAWTRVLASQMHDILPGTSTPTAYRYAQNDEVLALNLWTSIIEDSARAIVPCLEGEGDLLLYNPAPMEREDMVEAELPEEVLEGEAAALITGPDGREYEGQIGRGFRGTRVVRFRPVMKSLSWGRYDLKPHRGEGQAPGVVLHRSRDGYILDNGLVRVSVSGEGVIGSVMSEDRGLLKAPLAYELQREVPGIFPAWNMNWKDRKQPPYARIEGGGSVEVIEEGPLSCALVIRYSHGDSRMEKELRLDAGAPLLDFTERINWREKATSLKLAFTADIKEGVLTTNWESSRVERGVNSEKSYEFPSRYWADLSDPEGWGFSLIEDCKYGYDRPNADTLRMTLLFTPGIKALDAFRDQGSHDWGEHTVRYALYAHRDGWYSSDKHARLYNQPVRPFLLDRGRKSAGTGSGNQARELSLFSTSGEDFAVSAVKIAEGGESLVIRAYEKRGRNSSGSLDFTRSLKKVERINGLEERVDGETVTHRARSFDFDIAGNSLAAWRVTFERSASAEVPSGDFPDQMDIPLSFDCRLISADEVTGEGVFPSELMPDELRAGAVRFRLYPFSKKNAMHCSGQKISIPAGGNRLMLLCTAASVREAVFVWRDGAEKILGTHEFEIPGYVDFIGQWDSRIWEKEPEHEKKQKSSYIWNNRCIGVTRGFVRRDRVEWFTTHTHINGENQPYQFGYLYTLNLSVPPAAEYLQLPDDSSVFLLGATVYNEPVSVCNARYLHDQFDF